MGGVRANPFSRERDDGSLRRIIPIDRIFDIINDNGQQYLSCWQILRKSKRTRPSKQCEFCKDISNCLQNKLIWSIIRLLKKVEMSRL